MERKPAVSGLFYPSDKRELTLVVTSLINRAPELPDSNIRGLVSPHAGYLYSGKTAAYGFKGIKGKPFGTVVVLSPSHREYFKGVCIYEGDAYLTPLGKIPIDHDVCDALCTDDKIIFRGRNGHGAEHGIEVQLPFLQSALEEFKLVPVVMGDQSRANINILAKKLSSVLRDDILVIASSDLSHFYTHDHANMMDSLIEDHINSYNYNELQIDLDSHKVEACGGGLITAMMQAFDQNRERNASVLYRNDSSEATGDKSEVVGYLSAIVYH